jgi:nucleoside 2-deoxyribosyltransferase
MELTLTGFINWDKGKTDLSKILQNLEKLNMPLSQLENLRILNELKVQPKQPNDTEKQIEFKQSTVKVNEKLCFIIMPYTDKLNPIYENIIKPVIKDLKLECLRADEIFTSKSIIEDIWNNIKKARFIIADLTDRNPNVFYELGLAHALNKEVILLTQDINDVPFDLRHLRFIVYQDSIAGADKLKSDLKNFINEQINGNKK